ncbi:hypothetical protein [Terriglobus saanensis]|uniref:hypothetical protein n=1 Tax=Terriglobus saanensis TaxID=870903 RepID=UPI000324BEDE|nr:hypothetical protein [Terriglobus saanensis]
MARSKGTCSAEVKLEYQRIAQRALTDGQTDGLFPTFRGDVPTTLRENPNTSFGES